MVFNKRTLSITSKYSTLDDDEYGDMPYSKRLLSDISRKLPITSNLRIVDFNETFSEIKQLGIGRFGPVKQYLNKNNNKFVVGKHVKMEMFDHMYQDWGKIKKRINDFLKELEILYNLSRKHDRIADFLGIYNDNEKLIIFTEYLCNGSVKDKLEDGVGLSEKLTLKYFYQVCEGLHWLHDRSSPVVHRDIKAANILITAYDDVKLANFGLVRDLAIDGFGVSVGSEVSFDFRGTMLYVAPEVITSELGPGNKNAYGKPADMWALGCTIIEMLVCHPPYFEYFGCVEEMQKEVRERANGPIDKQLPYESKVLCPTASKHIKFLVDKLFEKNPDYRITVGQLIKLKRKMDETIESNYIDINAIYEKLKLNDSTGTLFSSDINSTRSSIEISALKDCNNTVKTLHKEEEVKGIKIGSSFNSTTKKQKKSNTIKDSAICCAFFSSRLLLFLRYYIQSFCYTASFVFLGILILAIFFSITFGVIHGARIVITKACNCDLNQPQFLIISGIFFILLFALLFSCCMVAIGEYKFRMASRSLRKSRYYVKRPSHDLKILGFTVINKENDDNDGSIKEIPTIYIQPNNNKKTHTSIIITDPNNDNVMIPDNNNDDTLNFYYN